MSSNTIMDLRFRWIEIDGLDITDNLLSVLETIDVDVIILGGVTFAGFNIVNIRRLYLTSKIPVIVFISGKPDSEAMYQALRKHFPDWEERWAMIEDLDKIDQTEVNKKWPPIYYGVMGISKGGAEKILRYSARLSRVPESVRVAGIIAKGLTNY
jgi:hypothetical protein